MDTSDVKVLAGRTGDGTAAPHGVRAYDVTAAPTTISLPECNIGGGAWLSLRCDQAWFVRVGKLGMTGTIDPTARTGGVGSDDEVCLGFPADYEWVRWFDETREVIEVVSAGVDGVLRIERVSIIFGQSNEGA